MPGLVPGSYVSRTVRKQHGGKKCGLASRATLIQRQANWGAMISAGRPILITVHGIRTFGEWQERLQRLVRRAISGNGGVRKASEIVMLIFRVVQSSTHSFELEDSRDPADGPGLFGLALQQGGRD